LRTIVVNGNGVSGRIFGCGRSRELVDDRRQPIGRVLGDQARQQPGAGLRTPVERPHHVVGGLVEREDRGARHEVHERAASGFEAVMLAIGKRGHREGSELYQFM
jgi:hypothetical protein